MTNKPASMIVQAMDFTIRFFSLKRFPPSMTVNRLDIRFTGITRETIAVGIAIAVKCKKSLISIKRLVIMSKGHFSLAKAITARNLFFEISNTI